MQFKKALKEDTSLREELGVSHTSWKDFWTKLDRDGDGKISQDELSSYIASCAEVLDGT